MRYMTCACGQPGTTTLHVHYKYPRREYLAEAADPLWVSGSGYHILTCGDPGCEADAYLAAREQIIDDLATRPGFGVPLTGEQLRDVVLTVHQPGDYSMFRVVGEDEDDGEAGQ